VLLYFLLVWTDAFADQSAASSRTNMSRIHKAEYSFPTTEWNHVPRYAKQLISSLILHGSYCPAYGRGEALSILGLVILSSSQCIPTTTSPNEEQWSSFSSKRCRSAARVKTRSWLLSTNSSSPYSDQPVKQHAYRDDRKALAASNRFYDIDDEKTKYRIIST
jgi:hypothetical protein